MVGPAPQSLAVVTAARTGTLAPSLSIVPNGTDTLLYLHVGTASPTPGTAASPIPVQAVTSVPALAWSFRAQHTYFDGSRLEAWTAVYRGPANTPVTVTAALTPNIGAAPPTTLALRSVGPVDAATPLLVTPRTETMSTVAGTGIDPAAPIVVPFINAMELIAIAVDTPASPFTNTISGFSIESFKLGAPFTAYATENGNAALPLTTAVLPNAPAPFGDTLTGTPGITTANNGVGIVLSDAVLGPQGPGPTVATWDDYGSPGSQLTHVLTMTEGASVGQSVYLYIADQAGGVGVASVAASSGTPFVRIGVIDDSPKNVHAELWLADRISAAIPAGTTITVTLQSATRATLQTAVVNRPGGLPSYRPTVLTGGGGGHSYSAVTIAYAPRTPNDLLLLFFTFNGSFGWSATSVPVGAVFFDVQEAPETTGSFASGMAAYYCFDARAVQISGTCGGTAPAVGFGVVIRPQPPLGTPGDYVTLGWTDSVDSHDTSSAHLRTNS